MECQEPGFAPVCAMDGHYAPNRRSFAGSDVTGTQPGQLELSGRARLGLRPGALGFLGQCPRALARLT